MWNYLFSIQTNNQSSGSDRDSYFIFKKKHRKNCLLVSTSVYWCLLVSRVTLWCSLGSEIKRCVTHSLSQWVSNKVTYWAVLEKGQEIQNLPGYLFYNYYLFVRWEALLPLRNCLSRMMNIDDGHYYRKDQRQDILAKTIMTLIPWLWFQVSNWISR